MHRVELYPVDGDWEGEKELQICQFFTALLTPHYEIEAFSMGDGDWDELCLWLEYDGNDQPTGILMVKPSNDPDFEPDKYDILNDLEFVLTLLDIGVYGYLAARKRGE